MKLSYIQKYGIVLVVILVVVNAVKYFFDSAGAGDKTFKSNREQRVDKLVIPSWLEAELLEQKEIENLFSLHEEENFAKKTEIEQKAKKTPGEPRVEEKTVPDKLHNIKVLAVNTSGGVTSGMVEYNGSVMVVFPGDKVGEKYTIRRITSKSIEFDPI